MDLVSNALLQAVNKRLYKKMHHLVLCFYIDRGPKNKCFLSTLKKSANYISLEKRKNFSSPIRNIIVTKSFFGEKKFKAQMQHWPGFFCFVCFFLLCLVIIRENIIRPSRSMLQCFH